MGRTLPPAGSIFWSDLLPTFSQHLRRELHKLGVTDEQVQQLESVLPVCRSALRVQVLIPDKSAVKDKLTEIRDGARALAEMLQGIGQGRTEHEHEALNRLGIAA